jgi:ribosomal protein L17
MNSIKTTVKVLENVKALTYKGLDLKMLNEAIDYNKNQLNTNESVEIELDELTKLSNMCTTIINESKIVDEKDKEKTKEKVIDYLIKAGNNENDVNEMVEKLFDEAFETYHTVKTISDYIRTNY